MRTRVGNFAALGTGELAAKAVAFVVTALLSRRLGTAGFGELAFASAVAGYFLLVPYLAIGDLGARAVARSPEHADRLIGSITRIRLIVGAGAATVIVALAYAIPVSSSVRSLIALTALSVFPIAANASWAYKALERMNRVGVGLVLSQLVTLVLVLLIVHGSEDLLRVPVVQAIGEIAMALLLFPLVARGWRAGSTSEGRSLLRGAPTLVGGRLLRALIVTSDMVMLGFLSTAEELGLYSAAYRICFLLTAVAASAHVVFHPALMRAQSSRDAASAVLGESVWLSVAIGLPVTVGGALCAPGLLASIFGEEYRGAAPALQLLLVSIGLLFVHGAVSASFLARHELRLQTRIVGLAAVTNVGLNAVLIAPLGIVGAALATVVAEAMILVCTIVMLARWRWVPDLRPLVKPLVATAVMAVGVALSTGHVHTLVQVAAAGILYATLLFLLDGLPPGVRESLATLRRGRSSPKRGSEDSQP